MATKAAMKKLLAAGAVAAVAVVAVGGVIAARRLAPPPKPEVLTAVAKMGDVEKSVLATGELQPRDVVEVGAEVSGRLTEVRVGLGDHVTRGQIIALVDPTRLQSEVRQQQQSIIQAEANLRDRVAQLEDYTRNTERQHSLLQRGVIAQEIYNQQLANQKSRESQVENQRQQLENQKIILEQRMLDLDKATIRAPMDGVVAEVVTRAGATLNVNRETPVIVKLARMDTMTVRAHISEADIIKVRPGQKAYFTILGEPQNRHYATVKTLEMTPVGRSLDPTAKTAGSGAIYYNVEFEAPNPDRKLMPAMTAEVHVVLGEANDVLTVPATALARNGEDQATTVEVVEPDGDIAQRPVEVGVNNNFIAEIKDGLKAGDRVVIAEAAAKDSQD